MNEFEFIELLKGIGEGGELPLGDDAALLEGLLITKDVITENTHFLVTEGSHEIAKKLIVSNVSDICAMGGLKGKYFALLGAGLAEGFDAKGFAGAFRELAERFNITLLGGDTVRSERLFLSLTLIGYRGKRLLKRSGAKPADLVYLSRPVGGERALLERRLKGERAESRAEPERELGELLGELEGATSCIDISDGLGGDLAHIARESGAGIFLESGKIPVSGGDARFACSSGEEYALAFTVERKKAAELERAVRDRLGRSIYRIGEVKTGSGVFLDDENISELGFRHEITTRGSSPPCIPPL